MNYIKEIEHAIQLFNDLQKADSKKKLELVENMKGNELAEKLVDLLKDESVKVADLLISAVTDKNEGRIRLQNFVRFMQGIEQLKEGKADRSIFEFILRHLDQEEANMYQAILTNTISISSIKEVVKEKAHKKKNK